MKKIYLVHCWDGTSNDGWYPWLSTKLNDNNVEVIRFDMPNTANPKIEEWVDTLNSKVDRLDKNIYFIGHSIGCQTILRYLETKDISQIGGILFVAPWLDLLPEAIADEESYNTAKPWLNTPIDFEKIKQFTNNIHCIFSNDDYFVSLEQEKEFKNKLNSQTCIVENKGHISQDDNVFELQEILELSKKMITE
mgnify:CR=1 FL=1